MNEVTARIIAHLIGDGCVTSGYLRYCNTNEKLLQQFRTDIKTEFGNVHFTEGKVNSGTRFVHIRSKEIVKKLYEYVKSYKSGDAEIPQQILVGPSKLKAEFLRALFDDEGSVGLRVYKPTGEIKRDVHMASKSRKLLEQIKRILENEFKIRCNRIGKYIKNRNGKQYITLVLHITGRTNLRRFSSIINFSHLEKRAKLQQLLYSYKRPLAA